MSGVNKVILLGNIGKDPEIRYTGAGTAIANLTLATSEKWKDKNTGEWQEKTEWHKCVVWGKQADTIGQYVHKGDMLYVEGKIQTRKYQKDGQDRYSTEIVVDSFNFCGGKSSNKPATEQRDPRDNRPQPQQPEPGTTQQEFDDDIPF